MTAIVGILNHRGVAFAADSAATRKSDSGTKITNNANKIFALSKFQPVGVAIYNTLSLFSVPWENIIKKCRQNFKDKSFDKLEEYVKEFWAYTKTYCAGNFPDLQTAYLEILAKSYFNDLDGETLKLIGGQLTDANEGQYYSTFISRLDYYKSAFESSKAEDFKSYTIDNFKAYAKPVIEKVLVDLTNKTKANPKEFGGKFCESFYAFVCHTSHTYLDGNYTGLVFFGYGDKEVFPSYRHYKVTYAIDNRLKYTLIEEFKVVNSGSVSITPFAQSDVTNTVIRAVEDSLRKKFYDSFDSSIKGFRDDIVKQMNDANAPQQLIDVLNGIDITKHLEGYKKGMNDYIKETYTSPLLETVSFLGKEDLADLAESLVRMTCIKRHFTTTEETVGGPVDVAVVTPGDGFIWMKRKHYFDPDLNHQFFER